MRSPLAASFGGGGLKFGREFEGAFLIILSMIVSVR